MLMMRPLCMQIWRFPPCPPPSNSHLQQQCARPQARFPSSEQCRKRLPWQLKPGRHHRIPARSTSSKSLEELPTPPACRCCSAALAGASRRFCQASRGVKRRSAFEPHARKSASAGERDGAVLSVLSQAAASGKHHPKPPLARPPGSHRLAASQHHPHSSQAPSTSWSSSPASWASMSGTGMQGYAGHATLQLYKTSTLSRCVPHRRLIQWKIQLKERLAVERAGAAKQSGSRAVQSGARRKTKTWRSDE